MNVFMSAEILLPKECHLDHWPVIACDQFTSDPAYWERVRQYAQDVPSAMHLILPEAELGADDEAQRVEKIHGAMQTYLDADVLRTFPDSYI
jgi:hypothetical protein